MAGADTICALASGAPPSAIAVIRISGPAASNFAENHIDGPALSPRRVSLRSIKDQTGAPIDEGLSLWMPGPDTYTGEDTLEFYLHGGRAVIEHMLETLTNFPGIRLAEPGEFTRRAFEVGRLDLTQAEGVADLIEAETRAQKAQAVRQAQGALGDIYQGWRAELLACLALIEVAIDFPDEGDAPESTDNPVRRRLEKLQDAFGAALADGGLGQKIREGFTIALIGEPNVGKSSILNSLAKQDAAIVTATPGTTRDIIEIRTTLAGHIIWLADTAGLRETADDIEAEGVKRARMKAQTADLRLHVRDASRPAHVPRETESLLQDGDIEVWNKIDLATDFKPGPPVIPGHTLTLSAKDGLGLQGLTERLEHWVKEKARATEAPTITRARHRAALEEAQDHLNAALAGLKSGLGAELVAEDVRLTVRALGSVIGDIGVEDVLGAVFSEFCIGK